MISRHFRRQSIAAAIAAVVLACGAPGDRESDAGMVADLDGGKRGDGGRDVDVDVDASDEADAGGATDAGRERDAGASFDAGADASTAFDAGRDGGIAPSDAGPPDSGPAPAGGSCDPYRDGSGTVSSRDCEGSSTPICDAVTRVCSVRRAETPCGPCRSDADCEGTYPGSICVRINEGGSRPDAFMPRGADYACALRCSTVPPVTSGCATMMSVTGWSAWECTSAARVGETTAIQVCLVPTSATTGAGGCRRDSTRRVRDLAGGG